MGTGYSIHKRRAEKEAVERWENEGGRLNRNHDYILASIGEEYRRHKGQVMQSRKGPKAHTGGRAQSFLIGYGEAKPRLTSGGRAAMRLLR